MSVCACLVGVSVGATPVCVANCVCAVGLKVSLLAYILMGTCVRF